jgi:hypothetical protein
MPPPRLLDQVRERPHVKHYRLRTEDSRPHWIRCFIFSNCKADPGIKR